MQSRYRRLVNLREHTGATKCCGQLIQRLELVQTLLECFPSRRVYRFGCGVVLPQIAGVTALLCWSGMLLWHRVIAFGDTELESVHSTRASIAHQLRAGDALEYCTMFRFPRTTKTAAPQRPV